MPTTDKHGTGVGVLPTFNPQVILIFRESNYVRSPRYSPCCLFASMADLKSMSLTCVIMTSFSRSIEKARLSSYFLVLHGE